MPFDDPTGGIVVPTIAMLTPKAGRGGAREGAGRKPSTYVPPPEVKDFNVAKARSELAKALKFERENAVAEGTLVSRAAVQQAAAVTLSGLAQSLRSIRDNLEQRGVALDVCEQVDEAVEEAMAAASLQMELMANPKDEN